MPVFGSISLYCFKVRWANDKVFIFQIEDHVLTKVPLLKVCGVAFVEDLAKLCHLVNVS